MVYAFIQDVPIGEDVYRRITDEIGPEPIAGQLMHLCIREQDGRLRYIDVWESEQACAQAFDQRIHPAVDARVRREPARNRARGSPSGRPARQRRATRHELVMSATTSGVPQGTTVQRGARVLRVPPPLYYAAAFAAGMLLRGATVPLAIGARPATGVVGVAVLGAGLALALAGVAQVLRHRTTIVPHHPVSALVTCRT